MPVRWTPDNDQLLLLKILETHDLTVDTKKVAEAWPGTDAKEKPTPRAISERIFKMRQMAKSGGGSAGSFAIKKGAGAGGFSSNRSTPTKSRSGAIPAVAPGSGKDSSAKRKLPEETRAAVQPEKDEDTPGIDTPTKPKVKEEPAPTSTSIKLELVDSGRFEDTPSKRPRKSSRLPFGMVDNYGLEDDQTERESSASEYIPDEFLQDSMIKNENAGDFSFA